MLLLAVADVPDGKLQQTSSTKTSSRAKFNLPNPNLFYIASQIATMEPDPVTAGASSSLPPSPAPATSTNARYCFLVLRTGAYFFDAFLLYSLTDQHGYCNSFL
jgi:hypothetical protein